MDEESKQNVDAGVDVADDDWNLVLDDDWVKFLIDDFVSSYFIDRSDHDSEDNFRYSLDNLMIEVLDMMEDCLDDITKDSGEEFLPTRARARSLFSDQVMRSSRYVEAYNRFINLSLLCFVRGNEIHHLMVDVVEKAACLKVGRLSWEELKSKRWASALAKAKAAGILDAANKSKIIHEAIAFVMKGD